MMAASTPNKKPGLRLIQDEFWYAGALSERKAEQVLTKLGDKGAFLVRDSLLPDADYVLSVKGSEDIDHYQITVAADDECALNGYTFNNISDAIEFYTENRIGKVFLNPPVEPVVSQVVVPKTIVPKIKPAPIPSTHQPQSPPQATTDALAAFATNTNEVSESAITSVQKPESNASNEVQNPKIVTTLSPVSNTQIANSELQQPEIVSTESSTDKIQTETTESLQESNSTKNEKNQIVKEKSCEQIPHQAEAVESNPPMKDQLSLNTTENTSVEHTKPTKESPKLAQENTEEKPPPDEDAAITLPPINKLEPSDKASNSNDIDTKNAGSSPLPQIESTSKEIATNADSQIESLPSPKNNAKAEQTSELKQLPSIGDKKKALEAKLRGKAENTEKKRKIPPPVPKRVSTATNLFQIQSNKTKEDEPNPNSEVVQSDTKKSPLPTPKKLSIPLNFQQNNEEDSEQKLTSPTETPKRLIIPVSLQVQPPPPPLSTHPGLAKKEEERQQQELQQQQQLLQAEAEKLQPQKSKKRSSFFKKKNKDSDKATVKRTPSIKADEPISFEEAERKKQQEQEEASINANPPPRPPKKVLGVPTLAISPQLDASAGSGELESIFKTITKHVWHPEDNETKIEVVKSTFGEHSKVAEESSEKSIKPEASVKIEAKPKQQKTEIPKQKTHTHTKKESIGEITRVNTFHPEGFSTPPEIKETNFTFTTPISTEIYLSTDFLKESNFNSQDTPPITPNSTLNSSSTSSICVTDTSLFIAQSPTARSSTPSTPKTPSTSSQNTPKHHHTTPSPKTNNAPPSPIPAINEPLSNSGPQASNNSTLPQSKSTGSLPSGFVVISASNQSTTVNPFNRQQHSLVDVVPGIPKKSVTLRRGQSMDIVEEEDVDSSSARKRAPLKRSSTINISGQEKQNSIGPMNSKRTVPKKKGIFKKK